MLWSGAEGKLEPADCELRFPGQDPIDGLIDLPGWWPFDTQRGSNMYRTRDETVSQSESDLPAADTWFSGICYDTASENILYIVGYCRPGRRDPASRFVVGAKNRAAIWDATNQGVRVDSPSENPVQSVPVWFESQTAVTRCCFTWPRDFGDRVDDGTNFPT